MEDDDASEVRFASASTPAGPWTLDTTHSFDPGNHPNGPYWLKYGSTFYIYYMVGDKQTGTIVPDFDRSIGIDFQGAKITCDTGFLLMREIDERFNILSAARPKSMTPDRFDIRTIPCSNCSGRESIKLQEAMRTAMTPIT